MRGIASACVPGEPQCSMRTWYFSSEEIENHSPSRDDEIDFVSEERMRKSYCTFIQELGMKLKVPQLSIATAIMFCHRFYTRQSHAKNDWQTVATVCSFLACKVEETPCSLRDVIVVAYEMAFRWDPSAPRRIRDTEFYDKQRRLILIGERLLLSTLAFDLNIQHPYKPLVAALKRLEISQSDLVKVAWNFVNDWLFTSLCIQYKPHYIAAASLFLAAKLQRVKLPTGNGKSWWLEFDVMPKNLEAVIQQIIKLLTNDQQQPTARNCVSMDASRSSRSCVIDGLTASKDSNCRVNAESVQHKKYASPQSHAAAFEDNKLWDCGSSSGRDYVNGCYGEVRAMKMKRCELVTMGGGEREDGMKPGSVGSKRKVMVP